MLRWHVGDVEVAYSTRSDGDQRDGQCRRAWLTRIGAPVDAPALHQVHGVRVRQAGEADGADGDAVIGGRESGTLVVFGADCPGLVIAAPDALALAHCGWRGTAAGMVAVVVDALAAQTAAPPAAWKAFIGPGISGAVYEVDAPVLAARRWPSSSLRTGRNGHAWLDLSTAIAADCRAAGIADVAVSGVCTYTDDNLHSYRRDGPGIVQALAAWRRA